MKNFSDLQFMLHFQFFSLLSKHWVTNGSLPNFMYVYTDVKYSDEYKTGRLKLADKFLCN